MHTATICLELPLAALFSGRVQDVIRLYWTERNEMDNLRLATFLLLIFDVCSGLRWANSFPDHALLETCSGDPVTLDWRFSLTQGERVQRVEWSHQPKDGQERKIATYTNNHFVPSAVFSGRVQHVQTAGVTLRFATIPDSGNYTVQVTAVSNSGAVSRYSRTVQLRVNNTPKTYGGYLQVRQEQTPVRDVTTGQWHVLLSCGLFADRGHPPVSVTWTTPEGKKMTSSDFKEGNFHMLLSNPVKGGNYTCSLPSLSPATRCLLPGSALRNDVTVDVDELAARISLVEARQLQMQDDTQKEIERLHDVNAELKNETETLRLGLAAATLRVSLCSTENAQLQAELDAVKNENDQHKGYINTLQNTTRTLNARLATAMLRVSFHAKMNYDFTGIGNFKPFYVFTNEGAAFSGTTGIFTAPTSGTYFFAASTGTSGRDNWANMYLKKDHGSYKAVSNVILHQLSDHYTMGSVQATLYLRPGQRISLFNALDSAYYSSTSTSFTGFLIRADD